MNIQKLFFHVFFSFIQMFNIFIFIIIIFIKLIQNKIFNNRKFFIVNKRLKYIF